MHSYITSNRPLRIRRHGRQSIGGFVLQTLGILLVLIALVSLTRAAGNLDTSFGGGTGKVIRPVGALGDHANAMAVQPDGKIVVVGATGVGPSDNTAVVRFNSDGTLDPTFNFTGIATFNFSNHSDEAKAVALQSDGKIVIAGLAYDGNFSRMYVARLTANGDLDNSFNGNGVHILPLGPGHEVANGVVIQQVNGEAKIVIAGSVVFAGESHFGLARLNSNGTLDPNFGTGGRVTSVIGTKDVANDVIIHRVNGEDRIVAVGYSQFIINGDFRYDFTVVRYLPNGFPDNSFDGDGKVTTDITIFDEGRTAVVQPIDGQNKLVVGGWGYYDQRYNFTVIRYNESGTVDTTFGFQGRSNQPIGTQGSKLMALARQSDNRIVAAGVANTGTSSNRDFALARFNANGTIDTSFGSCGVIVTSYAQSILPDEFRDVAVTEGGKILAAGITTKGVPGNSNGDIALFRYLPNGRAASPVSVDFDGDARADIAAFRPNDGGWYINNSCGGPRAIQFGANGDRVVPADYDGDGRTDIAVFRQGVWYSLYSSDNSFHAVYWGVANDVPVVGDYDADGKADIAVYRPSTSFWYVQTSRTGQILSAQFGIAGDIPVPADYDNDGRTNAAVFRPATGTWYTSPDPATNYGARQFGQVGDVPQTGDFDADGQLDLAVFRPSNGTWYFLQSMIGFTATQFGLGTDTPVAGDFDGDTKDDIAVFRGGAWYVLTGTVGLRAIQWGTAGDIPVGSK